jgi:hypothetical protein
MLTMDRPRPRLRDLALVAVMATAMATAMAPAALGADAAALDTPATNIDGAPEHAEAALIMLEGELATLSDRNASLADANSILSQDLAALSVERDRLIDSISHFDSLYDPLEADRQLLYELRKGLPETRTEAESQLARIQRLALSSNPARLGQVVSRVSEAAPAFFEWRFSQFSSTEEATAAYINTGANAFESSMEDFRSAVLLSVANRLDGMLNVIDRVR